MKNANPLKKALEEKELKYFVQNKNNYLQKDRNLNCHYTEKLTIREMRQKLSKKKDLFIPLIIFT